MFQRLKKKSRLEKHYILRKALMGCPQKRGACMRVFTEKPKKPNSSRRKLTKVQLCTSRKVRVHIMGDDKGVMPLQKHSTVLINGLRPQDMPAVKYRVIRGALDAKGVRERIQARSRYGIKNRNIRK